MPDVNEQFSRIFFEQCGFLVRTNVKYYVRESGNVGGDSDIDLVVLNLKPDKLNPPSDFVLTEQGLKGIEYAIVESKGWHEQNFSPSVIERNPRIFNFVRPESIEKGKEVLGTAHFKKVLVISSLSPDEPFRQNAIDALRSGGIDHVIEFNTIVAKLWNEIEVNKDYRSEILQTMRLIRKYV